MDLTTTHWTPKTYQDFLVSLESLGDEKFSAREQKIVPTNYPLLGIPMKTLRELGTAISKGTPLDFLAVAGTETYEVIIVRAYVLSRLPLDLAAFTDRCRAYIATADSWAICDMVIHFKQVKKFQQAFLPEIHSYLASDNPWFQRTGLVFLLKFYLTPEYLVQSLAAAKAVKSDDYYVQMGQAWLLATAFPQDQAQIYQLLRTTFSLQVVQKTVTKIKSLRHTTEDEKAELTAILAERRAKS